MPVGVWTSPSAVTDTSMVWAEKVRNVQVERLGSEARYRRINNKLANLEVDPLFYLEQRQIFHWRMTCLRQWRERFGEPKKVWPYYATKFFEETVEADNPFQMNTLPDGYWLARSER